MALARPIRAPDIASFYRWWLRELRGLLPARWRDRRRYTDACLLMVTEIGIDVVEYRRGRRHAVGRLFLPPEGNDDSVFGSSPVDPSLRRTIAGQRGRVVLVLTGSDGLIAGDILPAGAEPDLARIMRHKLDLLTPWPAEQVYFDQRIRQRLTGGRIDVALAVAQRARVDGLIARLASIGIKVDAVDIAPGATDMPLGANLLGTGRLRGRRRWLYRLVPVLLVLALLAEGLLVGGRILERQGQLATRGRAAAELELRLTDLPALRERLQSLRARASFFASERRLAPASIVVLDSLSRLLPDGVWLDELSLEGRRLVIGGFAAEAAPLVGLIEASPLFEGVRFQAPSTRVDTPGPDGAEIAAERFSISATVAAGAWSAT